MECSICYEQFIQPSSNEHYEELEKKFMTIHNKDENKDIKFGGLLLLPNMTPYKCPTYECNKYICDYCYDKLYDDKEIHKCAYCRRNDYKTYYKKNVLRQLQIKVLGKDGFLKWYKEQILNI